MNPREYVYRACFDGNIDVIKSSDIIPDDNFFYYAIIKDRIEVVKYLIEEFKMYPEKDTFLEAIKRNYVHLSLYMSQYIPFDYECLQTALENNCFNLIDIMLDKGLNIFSDHVPIILYGENIKKYIEYREKTAYSREKAATKIQNWWRYDLGRRRVIFFQQTL